MTTPPMAVIFDVDGVLVDSYRAHFESWMTIADDDGVPFTESDFAASFGMTSDEVIRRHWGTPDAPPSPEALRRVDGIKEQRYRDIVDRAFPSIPGATALIDALHAAAVPLAVGSSGPPENVGLVLDRLDRRDRFGAIISRADVTHGKPAPDIFALAATRLGVPADRCVVIEDAPPGVEAARAAGMHVVALLSNGRSRNEFTAHMPDRFVTSLEELDPGQLAALVTG